MHDKFQLQRQESLKHSVSFMGSTRDLLHYSAKKQDLKEFFKSTGVKTKWYRAIVGQKVQTSEVERFVTLAMGRWKACAYAIKLHVNAEELSLEENKVYGKYIGELKKDYTAEKKRLTKEKERLIKVLKSYKKTPTHENAEAARGQLGMVIGQLSMFTNDISKELSSQFLVHHRAELWRKYKEYRSQVDELVESRGGKSTARVTLKRSQTLLDDSLLKEERILAEWELEIDRLEEYVQGNPKTGTTPEQIYKQIEEENVKWHLVMDEMAALWPSDTTTLYQIYTDSKLAFVVEVESIVLTEQEAVHHLRSLIEQSQQKEAELKREEHGAHEKIKVSANEDAPMKERIGHLEEIFGLRAKQIKEQTAQLGLQKEIEDKAGLIEEYEEKVDTLAELFAKLAKIQDVIKAKILHFDIKSSSDKKYLADMKKLIALSRMQIEEARVGLEALRKLPKRVTGAIVYLEAAQATFPNMLKTIRVFKSGTRLGTATTDFTLLVGVSFGLKDPSGKLGASVGLAFEIGLGMNVGDDRRLRTKKSFAVKAIASMEFPKIFKAAAVLTLYKVTRTNTYADDFHLAASITHVLSYWKAFLKGAVERGEHNNDSIEQDKMAELLNFAQKIAQGTAMDDSLRSYYALAKLPYTRVIGWTFLDMAASLEAATASVEVQASPLNFNTYYRYDPNKEYQQGRWIICPVEKLTGTVQSVAAGFGFGNFKGVIKYTHVGTDPNPDNGGHYLNFSIAHSTDAELFKADPGADPVALAGLEDKLSGLIEPLEKASSKLPDHAGDWTKWMGALSFGEIFGKAPFGLALSLGITVEANFVWKYGLFRLQYVRATASYVNVSTECHIPIGHTGLNVDIQASYAMAASLFEIAGTNTLTYLATVHDGFNYGARNKPERKQIGKPDATGLTLWQEYTKKHKKAIWKAMCALATDGTNANKEAQEDFDGAGMIAVAKMSGLKTGLAFDQGTYDDLVDQLTTMFDAGNLANLSQLNKTGWKMADEEDQRALAERDREALEDLLEPIPEPTPEVIEEPPKSGFGLLEDTPPLKRSQSSPFF